jgi:hypothetical protein
MTNIRKTILLLVAFTLASTFLLTFLEGDKFSDSLYLHIMTLTTTGSAFSEPATGPGKLLISIYSLTTFCIILTTIYETLSKRKR